MKTKLIAPFLLLIFIVACTPQDTSLPTLIPTSAPVEPTENVPPAIPTTDQTEPTPTREILPTNTPIARNTLPPTWTVVPTATETPFPTVAPPTITPFNPSNIELPTECDLFQVDFVNNTTEFTAGEAPTIAFTSIPSATSYRVILADGIGTIIKDDIFIFETTYTFDASFFEGGEFYGWQAYPIDVNNEQMCNFVGAELIAFRPLGG